jgi:molecular chaperone GrpE
MNQEPPHPPTDGIDVATLAVETPPTESDSLRRELAEQRDLNLRLVADFANYRRRTRQDADGHALTQKDSFIRELLPILDNLERALASGASPGSPQFHQGVELTVQQFQQLLRHHGIETDASVGEPFNPHLHEAVFQRNDPAHPEHAILEVLQRGYRRGEKVVRHAKVVINELDSN